MTVGVPVTEQSMGDRSSPAGRLILEVNVQDVIAVPREQDFM